jgi:putative holliday junction resolvase
VDPTVEPRDDGRGRISLMTILLGFDFGMKHIGVAVGQSLTHTATPLTTIKAKDGIPNWQDIFALIQKWQPHALIVGIPLNMDGTEQPLTLCAKRFANRLETQTKLPVHRVDERLSSYEAKERVLKGKGLDRKNKKQVGEINAMSAAILVEQWLGDERDNKDGTSE